MYVVSIAVDKREKTIPEVQDILSEYGDNINTRLGVHDTKKENTGIILALYEGEDVEEFAERLNTIDNTSVNFMEV